MASSLVPRSGWAAIGGDLMADTWGLPGYTEVKVLGSGGFGEVMLAI